MGEGMRTIISMTTTTKDRNIIVRARGRVALTAGSVVVGSEGGGEGSCLGGDLTR